MEKHSNIIMRAPSAPYGRSFTYRGVDGYGISNDTFDKKYCRGREC